MLTICPTADYEIYLGRNLLPPDDVLFEPTRKLLDLWKEFGLRATLFPDICSIWRHRELGNESYSGACERQLRDAAKAGHDIQLHLHPEWLSAQQANGAWSFEKGTSSLNDLGFEPEDPASAPALVRKGKAYLDQLVRPQNAQYRCLAFRAGGWVLQPERRIVATLLDAGIRVDATVIPGVKLLRTDYSVDFRHVPSQPNWFISPERGLSSDSQSPEDLFEISIAAYRGSMRMWHHTVNEMRLRKRAKRLPQKARGVPIVKVGPQPGMLGRLARKYRKLSIPRALDLADTHESMLATLKSYLGKYDCVTRDWAVCMNGHPKDTYDFHLEECRKFFGYVLGKYGHVVRFESIADYYTRSFSA